MRRVRAPVIGNLLQRGVWGLADQALLSLASFVTIALIARANDPHDFGLFALALTFINLEMTVAASLLSEPFAVISNGYERVRYAAYVSSIFVMHLGMGVLVSAILVCAAIIDFALDGGHIALILLVIPAMLAWQLQDFVRQPLYVEGRVAAAFLNDSVSYGGQIGAIVVAYYFDVLTGVSALVIITCSSGAALLVGMFQLRHSMTAKLTLSEIAYHRRETWKFGRWVLGGTLLESASYNLQPFFLAAFIGATSAGYLRATMTLMGPARIIIRGIITAFTPHAAGTLAAEGRPGLDSLVRKIFLFGAPLMAVYCLVVSVQPTALVTFLLGAEYAGPASWLLPMLALSFFLQILFMPLEIGLRALRVTGPLFRVGVYTFLAFWCVGIPAIYFLGLLGAALLTLLIPTIVLIEFGRVYSRQTSPVRDGEAAT